MNSINDRHLTLTYLFHSPVTHQLLILDPQQYWVALIINAL